MSGSQPRVSPACPSSGSASAGSAPAQVGPGSELEVEEAQPTPARDAAGAHRLRERQIGMWEGVGADPLEIEIGGRTGVHLVYRLPARIFADRR